MPNNFETVSNKNNQSVLSTDYGVITMRPVNSIDHLHSQKFQSQSQIFRYSQSLFCLPHQRNFSDIFDLCLHWVSVGIDGPKKFLAQRKIYLLFLGQNYIKLSIFFKPRIYWFYKEILMPH